MSFSDIIALLPYVLITGTAVMVMLATAFHRNHQFAVGITVAGLVFTLLTIGMVWVNKTHQLTPLLIVDKYGTFFSCLVILATISVALLVYPYLQSYQKDREELYVLLLFATLGAMVVIGSSHFASLFLGLEILGVSLYAAIAYMRTDPLGIEAGVKYLVLAAVSDAILLFGMALLYGECGTLTFSQMARYFISHPPSTLTLGGLTLLVAGLGFKLSLVPFHMWTPDVYDGAPAPVTGFLATVSKGAIFALLLRYFTQINFHSFESLVLLLSVIAAISMVVGNILALLQENVKRIVAYSSIAHVGYLLVAFPAVAEVAGQAVGYYLAAYFAATIGAFGVIGIISEQKASRASDLRNYRGLFWSKPVLAGVFTVMLLSMAGIPLTAGFVGKFYIMAAGIQSSLWTLVIILIGSGIIGLYYYIRIIATMCLSSDEDSAPSTHITSGIAAGFVLALLTLVIFVLGIYPGYFVNIVKYSLSL